MATREDPWPDGYPNWIDLMTPEPDAARSFYADLFGWQFSGGEEMGGYWLATLGEKAVAGIGPLQLDGHPPVWTTYFATGDADASCDSAVRAGGTIVMPAGDVGAYGRLAYLQDRTRGTFGLWQANQHIGTQRVNEPGTLVWNELRTRDYGDAKDFYAAVFSFGYTELGGDDFEYATIEVDGRSVGGLGGMPPGTPDEVPPHWVSYFCVEDCDAIVDRATGLGGTVGSPPTDMPYGRFADLADPHGARFSVIALTTPS